MPLELKRIFRKSVFDHVFIRQFDDFSCTPAAFATAARLYDLDPALDFNFFRKALQTRLKGTLERSATPVANAYLPVTRIHARSGYHGGIELGAIRQKPDGTYHSVLFLGRRDDIIVYYDPYWHRIVRDREDNMVFRKGWVASLPPIKGADFDFWNAKAADDPYDLQKQSFWMKEHKVKFQP